jgi:hypothetical protein
MGNCQGKKASTDAVNTRSLDINKPIPSPVKEERTPSPVPVPVTSPSTPEEDKKQTDETSEPAESVVSEKVKEPEVQPEVAQDDSEVVPLESKTSDAISASTSAADIVTSNISEAKSDEKSTVSDVPVFDTKSDVGEPVIKESDSSNNHIPAANSIKEENGTRDLGSAGSVGRSLTEPTGVAEPTETKEEVEAEEVKPAQNTRDLTFMEKMEDTIDSCCGLPPNEREPVGGQEEVQEKEEIPTITSASISLDPSEPNYKSKRKLVKKLRQIEALESKDRSSLTQEQIEKIATKPSVLESLASTTD